jgi:hypothetical protein
MPERTYIIFDDVKQFFELEESATNDSGVTRAGGGLWVKFVCLACVESGRVPNRGNYVSGEGYAKGMAIKHWRKIHHSGPVSVQVDGPVAPDPNVMTAQSMLKAIGARLDQYIADHTMADDLDEMSEVDFANYLLWIRGWAARDEYLAFNTER